MLVYFEIVCVRPYLPFPPTLAQPTQITVPPQMTFSSNQQLLISSEVESLLEKQAITAAQPCKEIFHFPDFRQWFPKKMGFAMSGNKSENLKQSCDGGILQDGRFPYGEGIRT